ncbi:pilus assembly protein [Paenibacillus xylaniclasticus]|uniref:pilus assembly protein n=1 Tax=Paenibacillus xylaniclasticus TaxID=588083 RepID=UPI000FDA7DED|nr:MULTISPECIES: pilus assembly protein [Paenibacillus]GFN32084.1 hypothetical protein PCURB6_23440 [Paenibacillus curdlanolyticus]
MRSLIRDSSGSYSLEATLVLPLILVIVIVMLLFAGYTYEKTVLYGAAVVSSERTAYLWDNSYRDALSGLVVEDQYDSLYWRIGEDGLLQSFFGLADNVSGDAKVLVGEVRAENEDRLESSGTLAERKLARTSTLLSDADGIQGEIRFVRNVMTRRITTTLQMSGEVPLLNRLLGRSEPNSSASAIIVEPTEFIRTIDLLRYYTAKFGNGSGSTAKLLEVGSTLQTTAGKTANG